MRAFRAKDRFRSLGGKWKTRSFNHTLGLFVLNIYKAISNLKDGICTKRRGTALFDLDRTTVRGGADQHERNEFAPNV